MIKSLINFTLRPLGFEISNKYHQVLESKYGWRQYRVVKPDGSFDYSAYKEIQTGKNKRDISQWQVDERNIEFLSKYLLGHLPQRPKFGLCHGTKRGLEQAWFKKYLECSVLGTEISDTAADFPDQIQWDFHDIKPEWLNAADFIYSNALDHSFDPEKAINAWTQCLRPGGFLFVEWHYLGDFVNLTDPFNCDILQLTYAITRWGKGAYCVREVIPTITNPDYLAFVVVYKF